MKKLTFLYIALAGLLAFSCAKQEADPVLSYVKSSTISLPAANSSFQLTEDEAASEIKFAWSATDFDFNLAITYRIMMDFAGNDFANAFEVVKTTKLSGVISYADLNNKLNANGAIPGAVTDLEYRVEAYVSDDVDLVSSRTMDMQVTAYLVVVNYPKLGVPGSYQGWDPSNETTVIYSLKSDGKYEGYVYIGDTPAEFKFTDGPSWDVNWGDDGLDGTLDPGGANIPAAVDGVYKLNVNLNTLTYTMLFTDWGIIGSATAGGWDSDQNMTWDAENNVLTATLDLIAGEIKFRANDDWGLNYGDDGPSGYLNAGGANIVIADAGNYTITLNLGVANYTYTVVKN